MTYGVILAAGNQSRFESDTPKPLMDLGNDKTALSETIFTMMNFIDKIFVVVNKDNRKFFKDDIYDSNLIEIESGYGCGDAAMKALNKIALTDDDMVYITWGDSIQNNPEIYKKSREAYKVGIDITVPVVFEDKPYVRVIDDHDRIIGVQFSKYHEVTAPGWHDLSIFYSNGRKLSYIMNHVYKTRWHDNKYNTIHNSEFQFLDIFNFTNILGEIVKMDNVEMKSFNTIDEFNKLKEG